MKPISFRRCFIPALALILAMIPGLALADPPSSPNEEREIRALIVYYSWSNNTRTMAEFIERQTGYDIEELELVTPYIRNYEQLLDQVTEEEKKRLSAVFKAAQGRPEFLRRHFCRLTIVDIHSFIALAAFPGMTREM